MLIDADQPGATRPDARPLAMVSRALGVQTNNYAEYTAVVLALEKAHALGAREVQLVLDSKLVVEQLAGRWKVRHPGIRPLVDRALELLRGFERWTVRHEPRASNSAADALANLALDDPAASAAAEGEAARRPIAPPNAEPGVVAALAWADFGRAAADIAAAGERLLRAFSVGYMATIGPGGGPRVHPTSVSFSDGGLYVFILAKSRRATDLDRDPRYALHAFPHSPTDEEWNDEEFEIEGTARPVVDADRVASLIATHTDSVEPGDRCYELLVERAHWKHRLGGRRIIRHWPR